MLDYLLLYFYHFNWNFKSSLFSKYLKKNFFYPNNLFCYKIHFSNYLYDQFYFWCFKLHILNHQLILFCKVQLVWTISISYHLCYFYLFYIFTTNCFCESKFQINFFSFYNQYFLKFFSFWSLNFFYLLIYFNLIRFAFLEFS